MKVSILIFLFSFICRFGFAQNRETIENLYHKLAIAQNDTSRVLLMAQISTMYGADNTDSTLYYGHKALELANNSNFPKGQVHAMSTLSYGHQNSGNLPRALELSLKALQIAENNALVEEISRILNRIGLIYNELEDFPRSLIYYKRVTLLMEQNNQTSSRSYCTNLMNVGTQFEESNQLDSAEYYFQKSFQAFKTNKLDISAPLFRHLGIVQFKTDNLPLALNYYQKSLEEAIKTKSVLQMSAAYRVLSEVYQKIGKPDSSLYHAKQAFIQAQLISSKNRQVIFAALQLSKLYETINVNEALRYYKIAAQTNDSLYGKNNLEAIQTIVSQEEKRQKEIEVNQIKYENRLKLYALLVGLGMLLLITFILHRNNKKQKEANTLLYKQKEEIKNTLSQLKATQNQLIQSEKLASLGELTAGIAHEIQNPLNFVNNFSELSIDLVKDLKDELEKSGLTSEGGIVITDKAYFDELFDDLGLNQEKINHHSKRASSIVKGMLEHSRANTGIKEWTDINTLAEQSLRLSYHGLRAKEKSFSADFKTDFQTPLPKIEIISQDIGRVLLNLFNNAFYAVNQRAAPQPPEGAHYADPEGEHYTEEGEHYADPEGEHYVAERAHYVPTVTVSTHYEAPLSGLGGQIVIKIKDNGTGMPESVKAKIFNPFFTTKPTGEGTGLGLSLAHDIVTKGHGGALEVTSTEGIGTEFIIRLPA